MNIDISIINNYKFVFRWTLFIHNWIFAIPTLGGFLTYDGLTTSFVLCLVVFFSWCDTTRSSIDFTRYGLGHSKEIAIAVPMNKYKTAGEFN